MTKDEMKNRISMALKDPILQQGFEIICKENAELKADNDARKFAMIMSEKVEKQLREQIEKMKCGGNCKHEYWINTGGCYDQKCRFTGLDCTNCKDKWEIK